MPGEIERTLEATRELLLRVLSLLGRARQVEFAGGRVEQPIEGGEQRVASRHGRKCTQAPRTCHPPPAPRFDRQTARP